MLVEHARVSYSVDAIVDEGSCIWKWTLMVMVDDGLQGRE